SPDGPIDGGSLDETQGFDTISQTTNPANSTPTRLHPSALLPTPMYFSPEAKITNVMIGRMTRSGARDDNIEPTRTAGMLPMISDVVTPNETLPNVSAPSAAEAVNGS